MTILPFSPVSSSTPKEGSGVSEMARFWRSEATIRADLEGVFSEAFEATFSAVLHHRTTSGAGEACERLISEALLSAGREAVRVALESRDVSADRLWRDGAEYYGAGLQRATVMSSFGPVAYERQRYRRRGCASIVPAAEDFGVVLEHWSPLAARRGTYAMAMLPAGDCCGLFSELGGMTTSPTGLNSLVTHMEAQREVLQVEVKGAVWQAEAKQTAPRVAAISVSIDGAMLGMRKEKGGSEADDGARGSSGYREASAGTVSLYDGEGERIHTAYYGQMPEGGKATLKENVLAEARHWIECCPEAEVVCVADGATDNWTYFSEHFPTATQVFDLWHAAQHLKDALNSAYGEGSPDAQRRFEVLRDRLRDEEGGVDRIIRSLQRMARMHPDEPGVIRRVLKFFRKQRRRMRYAALQARNLPIGSGVVEAAVKVLITQRLKGSGMRWAHPPKGTGQAILSFRALLKSGRFDAAWREIHARSHEPEPRTLCNRNQHKILKMAD